MWDGCSSDPFLSSRCVTSQMSDWDLTCDTFVQFGFPSVASWVLSFLMDVGCNISSDIWRDTPYRLHDTHTHTLPPLSIRGHSHHNTCPALFRLDSMTINHSALCPPSLSLSLPLCLLICWIFFVDFWYKQHVSFSGWYLLHIYGVFSFTPELIDLLYIRSSVSLALLKLRAVTICLICCEEVSAYERINHTKAADTSVITGAVLRAHVSDKTGDASHADVEVVSQAVVVMVSSIKIRQIASRCCSEGFQRTFPDVSRPDVF